MCSARQSLDSTHPCARKWAAHARRPAAGTIGATGCAVSGVSARWGVKMLWKQKDLTEDSEHLLILMLIELFKLPMKKDDKDDKYRILLTWIAGDKLKWDRSRLPGRTSWRQTVSQLTPYPADVDATRKYGFDLSWRWWFSSEKKTRHDLMFGIVMDSWFSQIVTCA